MELIFDILATAIFAYVQGIFIIAGVVISGIALLVLFSELAPSKNKKSVKAKIIGVRSGMSASSENPSSIYYPVFEYVGFSNQMEQGESLSGSSNLRNKIPGTYTRVTVDKDNPGWVSPIGSTWVVIALIFLIVGLSLTFGSFLYAEYNWVTGVVWGLITLQMALKFRKIFIPKKLRETKEQFMNRRRSKRDENRKSLPLMDISDVRVLLRKQDKLLNTTFPIVLLIACALIGGGYYLYDKDQQFIQSAAEVDGYYIDGTSRLEFLLDEELNPDQKPMHRIDKYTDFLPTFLRSSKVTVFYNPKNPYEYIVNRGMWQGFPYKLMIGFGLIMLIQSVLSFIGRKRRMSRI